MKRKYIVGIDLGGTNLKTSVLDTQYHIKAKAVLSTKQFGTKKELLVALKCSILEIIKKCQISKKSILGVGIGVPGPVDVEKGIVHFFPNIPGWKNVPLKILLQKSLGLPVFIDNDANLMSLAEARLGAARGVKNALCLTLGTGVGGGVIIEGKLYRGQDFVAGEIGHVPLNEKGPSCNCGGMACLEAYIGNSRILAQARKLFKRSISLEELSTLGKKQNAKALKIWALVGTRLGVALSGSVNLLNLDAVVIGGGVANAGEFLFKKIRNTVAQRAMSVQARRVRIMKARLGDEAGVIGAAILVLGSRTQ